MMNVAGIALALDQLEREIIDAGIWVNGLGTTGEDADGNVFLHTYDERGVPAPVPDGVEAVVKAHVPLPPPLSPAELMAQEAADLATQIEAAATPAERTKIMAKGLRLLSQAINDRPVKLHGDV
jgi:hypothetical protein